MKLTCRCGYIMNNMDDRPVVSLQVQPDGENGVWVWWCPVCERIHVPDANGSVMKVFKPEVVVGDWIEGDGDYDDSMLKEWPGPPSVEPDPE